MTLSASSVVVFTLQIIQISRSGMFHRAEDPFPDDLSDDRGDESQFSTFRSQHSTRGANFNQNSLQRSRLVGPIP
jgi:hypothetical protein